MAITATQREQVVALVVGMFDAAPSTDLLTHFVDTIDAGGSIWDVANYFANTSEFKSEYKVILTNDEFAANFVDSLLIGTSQATKDWAAGILTGYLNNGMTRGEVANAAIQAVLGMDPTDAEWGTAAATLQNKVEVATHFALSDLGGEMDFAALQSVLDGVTADSATANERMALIDNGALSSSDLTQILTVNQDMLTGTGGDDLFMGWIFDNQNTAQSGDYIVGGGGTDTLMAEIGNSQNFAISLKASSVEIFKFRAQTTSEDGTEDDGDNDILDGGAGSEMLAVQIDAEDLVGATQFWSYSSRADLVIEDVQQRSDEITIGWEDSDSGNVDYEVYFDNIKGPGDAESGAVLTLELLDLEGELAANDPLRDNPYNGFTFYVDVNGDGVKDAGEKITLAAGSAFSNYNDFLAAVQFGLANSSELQALGVTGLTADFGPTFTREHGSGAQLEGQSIVITNSGPETLLTGGWLLTGETAGTSNVWATQSNEPPASESFLTNTNIIFDYVGSGSKGGHLVAGEISQTAAAAGGSGTPGIQEFFVEVRQNSWLDEMRSTNNALKQVNVESGTGYTGYLRIDNLDNVQDVVASGMNGALLLNASLDETVVDRDLNHVDTATNVNADDSSFYYNLGNSNDTLVLAVDEALVGHEDFELDVLGGTGDDSLTVGVVVNGATTTSSLAGITTGDLDVTTGEWYVNQQANVNINQLNVMGGAGNDTITAAGGGDYLLEGQAGDDTIYVDNTAAKSNWVLGSAAGANSARIEDITSTTINADILYNAVLTVSFGGFEARVTGLSGDASNGYVATQLEINNAIKSAIANDAVLSKLLSVEDGPGNVLKIQSLVDDVLAETAEPIITLTGSGTAGGGTYQASDVAAFTTTVKQALIAGEIATIPANTLDSGATDAEIATALNTALASLDDHVDAANILDGDGVGAASTFDNDSVVHADAGSNVIVLASDATSNNTVVFDEAWTKTTIVSFEGDVANAAWGDVLDFTEYMDNHTSTSGSALSAERVNTTLNTDATTEINSVTIINGATAAFTTTQTFAGLNGTNLLAAINTGGAAYGGIGNATLNGQVAAGGIANLVETAGEAVVLIENTANLGEFKVFQLTWNDDSATNAAGDYTAATLLGTLDMGNEDITNAAVTTVAFFA